MNRNEDLEYAQLKMSVEFEFKISKSCWKADTRSQQKLPQNNKKRLFDHLNKLIILKTRNWRISSNLPHSFFLDILLS